MGQLQFFPAFTAPEHGGIEPENDGLVQMIFLSKLVYL